MLTHEKDRWGRKEIVLQVDTRYDSPGFSATKATTIFVNNETNKIIHIEIGEKKECGNSSNRLESYLFEKGLDYLIENGLVIKEVVTDARRNLIAILEKSKYKQIVHSLDIWHKSKKINEKLGLDAKKKDNKLLRPWMKYIVNHFWYSCTSSRGDVKRARKTWLSLLSHIKNQHSWATGSCHHDTDITPPNGCQWLTVDSNAYKCLKRFVQNPEWCSSLKYYVLGRTTWRIENFNSHALLRYCPKRLFFSTEIYTSTNQLAVIDFNHHVQRGEKVTKGGNNYMSLQVSRRTKEWVVYKKLAEKDYNYLPELMATIMRCSYGITGRQGGSRKEDRADKPDKHELLAKKQSRM